MLFEKGISNSSREENIKPALYNCQSFINNKICSEHSGMYTTLLRVCLLPWLSINIIDPDSTATSGLPSNPLTFTFSLKE